MEVPFPEDENGNTYVLTIIDTFSRAVGLYAVPNLEARHAARMLVRHIGIFGCPRQIVSDRGTHFTADIIRELMVLVGTNHVLTLAVSNKKMQLSRMLTKDPKSICAACYLITVFCNGGPMCYRWCSVS